jgi:hypothetical protein
VTRWRLSGLALVLLGIAAMAWIRQRLMAGTHIIAWVPTKPVH